MMDEKLFIVTDLRYVIEVNNFISMLHTNVAGNFTFHNQLP